MLGKTKHPLYSKYVWYPIICAILFFVFVQIFQNSFSPNAANAYEWEKKINVYFGNEKMGSSENCDKVFPVSRIVTNAETLGPGALLTLLKGVSAEEKRGGYFTSLNDGILIQKFEIKNMVAYVDFNQRFSEVGGSCNVIAIRSQIEKTLNQFPDIDSVVISVNGETEGILES